MKCPLDGRPHVDVAGNSRDKFHVSKTRRFKGEIVKMRRRVVLFFILSHSPFVSSTLIDHVRFARDASVGA